MAAALMPVSDCAADDPAAPEILCKGLGPGPFALVILFLAPGVRPLGLLQGMALGLGAETAVIGCTTAGEIAGGYTEGRVVAIGLPAGHFAAETLLIPDLGRLDPDALIGAMIRARGSLARGHPQWEHEFAFLMVDGLSAKEDELTAALASGLGPVPLFGGSAADGTRFRETLVLHGGQALRHAAVMAMVRTDCPVRVFKTDHLHPTATRMVVTEADPARRIVRRINAEPAALEYARLVGKDPAQLSPFIFAAHPVVVRIGGRHHVRAIRQVEPNGDLIFYSAIDEGLVLTLAEPADMVAHLETELAALSRPVAPAAILACDCVLRRMEAEERQVAGRLSDILRRYRVAGFSTYGEQLNAMHVNQTLTGVAIYPPGSRP